MNCRKCGANLEPDDIFCPVCGTQVSSQNQTQNNDNGGVQNGNLGFTYERPANQEMNYNAQQVNNQTNSNQNSGVNNPNGNNSSNTIKIAIVAIIVLVIIGAIALISYTILSSDKKDKEDDENENENNTSLNVTNTNEEGNSVTNNRTNTISNTNVDDDNTITNNTIGNTTTNNKPNNKKPTSTYTVNLGEFELYVPDHLVYQVDTTSNSMMLGNEDDTWIVQFAVYTLPYDLLKQTGDMLKSTAEQQFADSNTTISDPYIETIDGVEYIIIEVTDGDETMLIAYTQLNSTYSAMIMVSSEDDLGKEALKEISPIFSTANYVGEASHIEANTNVNMSDIKKIFESLVTNE